MTHAKQSALYGQASVATDPQLLTTLLERLQEPGLVQAIAYLDDKTLHDLIEELRGWLGAASFERDRRSLRREKP